MQPPLNAQSIKTGILQQFVENAKMPESCKVLRVIHVPSDFVEQLPFATKYLAWRETLSLMYCKEEENSMINLLH